MGGRSSTPRTVQLDNDIPVGVITVSDDVVNRLKGLHSEARKQEGAQSEGHSGAAQPQVVTVYQGESTITALEVRRQKEEELRKNDLYWSQRLKAQEESLKQTQFLLETEYQKTIEEVRKRFEHTNTGHLQVSACKDFKSKLIECYQANPKQILNCSSVVAEFEDCVQQQRSKILCEKNKAAAAVDKTPCGCPKKSAASLVAPPTAVAAN